MKKDTKAMSNKKEDKKSVNRDYKKRWYHISIDKEALFAGVKKIKNTSIGITSVAISIGFTGKYFQEHLGEDFVASTVVALAIIALAFGTSKLWSK